MRRVVVTGVGVVSPIGIGREAFFAGLRQARSGVDAIRSFDASSFPTRIAAEVSAAPPLLAAPHLAGALAAISRDRKAHFACLAAQEAFTDAFDDPGQLAAYPPRRRGVIIATGLELLHLHEIVRHLDGDRLDGAALWAAIAAAPAGSYGQQPSDLAARAIARLFGVRGPFALDVSACAAGTQALGEAAHAIAEGAADLVVSGGYDSMVNPLGVGGFSLLGALSRANAKGPAASRPFDADRDGFVLGEGAAVVVLECLDQARARGAHVYAEILGYGSTMDAYRVSDPRPDRAGAVRAIRLALARARIQPEQIDYVNAHGTGTRKNDPTETAALIDALGEHAHRVAISSTKSQIGHLIGAAGAVECLACIFALTEGTLPATINLERPDPDCPLDYVPGTPRVAEVRTVLSNSFGFGGQNASIVLGTTR